MSKEIFEGKGGPHVGHAAGNTDVEKQASQLASDVKYKVKKSLGKDTKLNPAQVAKAYLAQLAKSPAPPVVKALAKRKIMGEEYTSDISSLVEKTMMNVLSKVFIEGIEYSGPEPQDEYILQLESTEDRKYKIRVTDKKTGNTYVRMATRAKISELRNNPNISSVEMTEYGEVSKSEASKGEQTAKTLGGGKKAKKDYDGDGKVESGSKEHAGAVHNAIQRRMGGTPDGKDTRKTVSASYEPEGEVVEQIRSYPYVKEEFISDSKKKDNKEQTIDVMSGKNNINVSPSLGESKGINEKKMTTAEKKEEKNLKNKYDDSGTKKSMIDQYGEKKGPQVYFAFLRKKAMQTAGYEPEGEVVEQTNKVKTTGQSSDPTTVTYPDGTSQQYVPGSTVIRGTNSKTKSKPNNTSQPSGQQMEIPKPFTGFLEQNEKVAEEMVERDTRADQTHHQVIKNKFRSLGDKNPILLIPPEELEKMYNTGMTSDMIKKKKMDDKMCEARALGSAGSDDDNPKGAKVRVSSGRGMTMTPAGGLGASKPKGDDKERAARQAAQAKKDRRAAARDRAEEGEDRLSRLVRSVQNSSYEPKGEVIDERTRERRGQPRPDPTSLSHRVMMDMRNRNKEGLMTRSGKTVAQHEKERGVPERDRPQPETSTPAERLERKKAQRKKAEQQAADMYKPRAGESD